MSDILSSQIKAILARHGIGDVVDSVLKEHPINIESLSSDISSLIATIRSDESVKIKLGLLYDHEKHNLAIHKEYKEELKFAGFMQKVKHKERVYFFSHDLKEVAKAFEECQLEEEPASDWLQNLVDSYTNSIDITTKQYKLFGYLIHKIRFNILQIALNPTKTEF